jgi:predicted small secreted protein
MTSEKHLREAFSNAGLNKDQVNSFMTNFQKDKVKVGDNWISTSGDMFSSTDAQKTIYSGGKPKNRKGKGNIFSEDAE